MGQRTDADADADVDLSRQFILLSVHTDTNIKYIRLISLFVKILALNAGDRSDSC